MTIRTKLFAAVAVAALALTGCGTDLGACDDGLAKAVYFTEAGLPMYGGQALIYGSCGRGTYCHSEGASGADRFGVPHGFDLMMQPDTGGLAVRPAELARLQRGQRHVYDERTSIYDRVTSGQMPPGGDAQRRTIDTDPVQFHARADGAPLPAIGSAAGREILRNWLACDSPVIERTGGVGTVGFVEPCEDGTIDSCICPEPTFTSIYDVLIQPQCGSVCHTPDVPPQFERNQLDMSTRALAYQNLVTQSATAGLSCMGEGRRRVIPGDPDRSTLVNKLENCDPSRLRMGATGTPVCDLAGGNVTGTIVCGDIMPLGGLASGLNYECFIAPVRRWIANGAPND